MKRALLILFGVLFLAPLARTGPCDATAQPDTGATNRAVQERALIRHCYAQYRGQADIMRCLAHGAI